MTAFVPVLASATTAVADATSFWDVAAQDSQAFGMAQFFNGGEGPDYSTNPWDTISINGIRLPGICSAAGLPTLKIDQKKKGGADSVTFTATGYLPGPINVDCMIWTASQWNIFRQLAPKIWRKPNKAKTFELAMSVFYPGLLLWGINQIIVQGVSTPEPGPVKQSKIIKIRCLEYVPPSKKDSTQTAKKGPQFNNDSTKIPNFTNSGGRPSDNPPGPNG